MIWRCPKCQDEEHGPRNAAVDHPCRLCPSCTLGLCRFVYRDLAGPSRRRKAKPVPACTWEGMDLQAELTRLTEFCPPAVRANPLRLLVKYTRKVPTTMGWARFMEREIELIIWADCHLGIVLAGLVHELAHFSVPGAKHSADSFRTAMVELVRDGYGVEPPMPLGRRCSQLDHSIEEALMLWVDNRQETAE